MHKAGTSPILCQGIQEGREWVLSCDSDIGMCHGIGYGFLGAESLVGCH